MNLKLLLLLPALFSLMGPVKTSAQVELPSQTSDDMKAIPSQVFSWSSLPVEQKATRERRAILAGSTTHLAYLEIHATTLYPGQKPHPAHAHEEDEELLIIRSGQVEVEIEGERKVLGPGSVAVMMPGDFHGFHNVGQDTASYYVMRYRSKAPRDTERGKQAGGSFMVDWNEIEYRTHAKGGRRNMFDRPTTMCEDFEMHVTHLNPGIQSHPPHTHEVEEIILMISGNIEMHIDGETPKAETGDLVFLDSQIPHAPTNIGEGQCMYFAFQWK